MTTPVQYPIGLQTFEEISENGYFYADKTRYVYDMTHTAAKYYFLSRPRRFGKSLFVSTLKSYFEGRRDLFKGLAIDALEKEWEVHPVLHFDMSTAKHVGKEDLESELNLKLSRYEAVYGKNPDETNINQRFMGLIQRACKKTGHRVVVLIDEYDAPLLDVVHEDELLPVLRNVMRNFYSPLKACDPYLRFVFLTGITKFSQLSIFSELNNIVNISMLPKYAGICGITKDELLTGMGEGIASLANALGVTESEAVDALARMYDGYHFAWPSPDIFNPYSILNAFENCDLRAYWFGSATPTHLLEMMRKFGFLPSQLSRMEAMAEEFDAPTETMATIVPLLYQSGYITIKGYDSLMQTYALDIPNKEVRTGLMRSLIPYYITRDTLATNNTVVNMARCLLRDDMDGALRLLQTFLSTIPYCDNTNYEGHWQQVLCIIFTLLGYYCDVEVHTATGRVDMVMATKTRFYIVEVKIGNTPEAAMEQIRCREYDKRFALYTLPKTNVAITFDCDKHTLKQWQIDQA